MQKVTRPTNIADDKGDLLISAVCVNKELCSFSFCLFVGLRVGHKELCQIISGK